MASAQINIRASETIIEELDNLVKEGLFRNRTEAVNEGLRMLIRRYRAVKLAKKMDEIAGEKHGEGKLSEILEELREEEDA